MHKQKILRFLMTIASIIFINSMSAWFYITEIVNNSDYPLRLLTTHNGDNSEGVQVKEIQQHQDGDWKKVSGDCRRGNRPGKVGIGCTPYIIAPHTQVFLDWVAVPTMNDGNKPVLLLTATKPGKKSKTLEEKTASFKSDENKSCLWSILDTVIDLQKDTWKVDASSTDFTTLISENNAHTNRYTINRDQNGNTHMRVTYHGTGFGVENLTVARYCQKYPVVCSHIDAEFADR